MIKKVGLMVRVLKAGSGLCLVGMVGLTCADVVGGMFDHPVLGSEELVGLMGSLFLAFALSITEYENGHIGVDLIHRHFKPGLKRAVDTAVSLMGAVFFGLVSWQSFLYAAEMERVGLVSPTIEFPVHYVIYGVALGSAGLALVILVKFLDIASGRRHE